MRGIVAVVAISAAVVLAVAAPRVVERSSAAGSGAAEDAKPLLPDFDAATPQGLQTKAAVVDGKMRFRVSFVSAVANIGSGPAEILGERDLLSGSPDMAVSQNVTMSDGSVRKIPRSGSLRYNKAPTHSHWHLLSFMKYELRRASDFKTVRPDAKTGFCLGDRYRTASRSAGPVPPKIVYSFDCAGLDPLASSVVEGISVGWGDIYSAWRDAQFIDVTGLKAGTYYLVHRANPSRTLLESNYNNNASSLKLKVTWPNGGARPPKVAILAACTNTVKCASGFFFDKI